MSVSKGWIVTTSGDRPLPDVVKDLTDTGFSVDQVLHEIGCITGTASEDVAGKVRAIHGVADVSPDSPIDIGLPDEPEIW